ncbi:MAG: glycosyltransferase involved in cell wall biosynthesis [Flavobacterium sp.]
MTDPKVCIEVVIPTYNRVSMLLRAVNSVLSQTYSNVKVTVIDNASGDGTFDAIDEIMKRDPRVKYIKHDSNIGMLGNLNYAFSAVTEDYFCLLTDDDYYSENFLNDSFKILSSNERLGFVALKSVYFDGREELIIKETDCLKGGEANFFSGLESFKYMTSWKFPLSLISILFRKPLAELYVEFDSLRDVGSDINFLFMCSAHYSWATCDKIGAYVSVHDESFSVGKPIINWPHHVIMDLRMINIIEDARVSSDIRIHAKKLLIKSLQTKIVFPYFWAVLRKIIISIHKEKPVSFCDADIVEFSYSDKKFLTVTLRVVNEVPVVRFYVRFCINVFIPLRDFINTRRRTRY